MDDLRFYVLLTVFQAYQDDVWMIMKSVCNGTPFMFEKISPRVRIELGRRSEWNGICMLISIMGCLTVLPSRPKIIASAS